MKSKILLILVLILVAGGALLIFNKQNDVYIDENIYEKAEAEIKTDTEKENIIPKKEEVATVSNSVKNINSSELAVHNSEKSCWSSISQKVYDLTSFITKHPGGSEAILSICGKDGTEFFNGQHGMDQKAKDLLPKFYIGDFIK